MLKIQQTFLKLYMYLLYVVFHNLEPQNAVLVGVKMEFDYKRSTGIFVRKNKKISIVIKNIILLEIHLTWTK